MTGVRRRLARHHLEAKVEFVNTDIFASRLTIEAQRGGRLLYERRGGEESSAGLGRSEVLCVYEKYGTDGKVHRGPPMGTRRNELKQGE